MAPNLLNSHSGAGFNLPISKSKYRTYIAPKSIKESGHAGMV